MSGLVVALRGLRHRTAASVSILLIAIVAAAAVTVGPTYYAAAQSSILQDQVRQAGATGRGVEVTQTGSVAATAGSLAAQVRSELGAGLGSQRATERLFAPPVLGVDTSVQVSNQTMQLVWRSEFCAHLAIVSGRCPSAPDQIAVSTSTAALRGWRAGQRIHPLGWPRMTVSGLYRISAAASLDRYWFTSGPQYFPYENNPSASPAANPFDAMFTPVTSLNAQPGSPQGTDTVDFSLNPGHLSGSDLPSVVSAMAYLLRSQVLVQSGATTVTDIPATLGAVRSSWREMEIPVVLVTAELVLLAWLLLFLIVSDAAEARGPEIALAKLRGRSRWRTLTFGLSEPVILLAVALPAGVLAGWGITTELSRLLLRPGTPVGLPAAAWVWAVVATVGGLAAVAVAARRTLARSVTDQWQQASRGASRRGWVVDAILLTATVAGLAELRVSGQIGSARRGVVGLLLPGVLGIAVAVVASRLLVVACRAGFGLSRRRGRIGWFLALRHVARRPGGMRTMIVLATAFALTGFAVGVWSVALHNIKSVAGASVGAPTVLSVTVAHGKDLAKIVDRADPGGGRAMAVDQYTTVSGLQSGQVMFAVDPQRFARIAAWDPAWSNARISAIARALSVAAPPPVVLHGDQVRLSFRGAVRPAGTILSLDVYEQGAVSTGQTPLYFGTPQGSRTVSQPLTGCPCVVAGLTISAAPRPNASVRGVSGSVTVTGIDVRSGQGPWTPVSAGLGGRGRWRSGGVGAKPTGTVGPARGGLLWQFSTPVGQAPSIVSVDRPYPLPALVAAQTAPRGYSTFQSQGLDGNSVYLRPVALATAIPGAPSNGIIVDRTYAERAAGGVSDLIQRQVWLAAGAQGSIEPALRRAGVHITGVMTLSSAQATLLRQGPALATVLFLADAVAAAVLAAAAAVGGLYLSARRRRYEYAALAASRINRRTIGGSLLAEQAVVLGFGAVTGLLTGFVATLIAVRNIPEFVTTPLSPPLTYSPSGPDFAILLAAALVILVAAAATASMALVRSVRPDLLREAEP